MIFVDVDGTLIDADDKPVAPVVAAVWTIIARNVHPVVIWSGGGLEYADQWTRRLFPGQDIHAMPKYPRALARHDVVVDDGLEFQVPDGAYLLTPRAFAEWVLDDGPLVPAVPKEEVK